MSWSTSGGPGRIAGGGAVVARAPAKVNVHLSIAPLRDDGYHDLQTVFLAVSLFDTVTVRPAEGLTLTVSGEGTTAEPGVDRVPTDRRNLVWRAAVLLAEQAGVKARAAIDIAKSIPAAAGLAGGSADAAAALVALDALWNTGATRGELAGLAAQLGSDVPFLLHGGNAIGGGRGETVSPVLARGSYHWVFATAPEGLSTAAVYAEFDRITPDAPEEPEVPDALLNALRAGDAHALGQALSNDLTDASLSLRPELADTLEVGLEAGALGAIISGSGPTTAFLAASEQHALDLAMALASTGAAADVLQSRGPVSGARLV